MFTNDIKINSQIISDLLSQKGKLSIVEIEEITGFKNILIILTLGWLSKEGKISFVENENMLYVKVKEVEHSEVYY
ncbi:MAG: winged helix-turn-helix domain-containing protein [Prevotella sp.]|jgi:hypothetical protein|nr:winged helix-turn-helix domain-containing protein [Prevotella sp.]